MTAPGLTWENVADAIGRALAGEGATALQECWDATAAGDHAQRCVLAHYLADQQRDLAAETAWDERALAEHAHLAEDALAPLGVTSVIGFAPSLHLNLGDDYQRAGDIEGARVQLAAARATQHLLPDDGYGATIRGGIERLAGRIDGGSTS